MNSLTAYDPRRDRPALLDRLNTRLAGLPPSRARALVQRFCQRVPTRAGAPHGGLVLPVEPWAFAFMESAGARCRVHGLVCEPAQTGDLVEALVTWLAPRHTQVLVEAEAWWRVLGLDAIASGSTWSRAGYRAMTIEVLETRLPAARGRAVPAGYKAQRWRTSDLALAAHVMAASPDALGERFPLSAEECRALLASTPDRGHGGTVWSGGELAGFVRATPTGDIAQLYVAQAHRNRGVGAHLLDLALGRLDGSRLTRARVAMAAGNATAHALYASRGFVRVDGYACRVFPGR